MNAVESQELIYEHIRKAIGNQIYHLLGPAPFNVKIVPYEDNLKIFTTVYKQKTDKHEEISDEMEYILKIKPDDDIPTLNKEISNMLSHLSEIIFKRLYTT